MNHKIFKENLLLFICLITFIKSDLIIIGPNDLISKYDNKPIEIVFGKISDIPSFYVHGEIIFENSTLLHDACSYFGVLPKKTNENEYSENFKILLAYNGNCSVVQKARNAQNAGASMLLLINNNEKDIKEVLLEDDGSGKDIKIPIGLISLSNGKKMQYFIENNPEEKIMVEINFQENIIKDYDKVQLKLFFSSSELRAYQFINNITKIFNKFKQQIDFTPIYVTHQSPVYNPENPQRELNCLSKGKYCYFPKEDTIIQDGQKILMESLRQKCMYKKNIDNIKYYYEYMQHFYSNCLDSYNIRFNERCSKQTLDSLGYPIEYLDDCVAESFGVNSLLSSSYIDNENTIFQKDYEEILKYKITSFPAVVINDKPVQGMIKEYKILLSICKAVKEKPAFCSFFWGTTDRIFSNISEKKRKIYFLILMIIAINILLFLIFRRYIMRKVNEKINFNTIDIDGRINNFMNNYMSLKKNQEMDYMSFDTDVSTKNNKGYNKVEGNVDTV